MNGLGWLPWAVGEGAFMGLAKFGHGWVGGVSPSILHIIFAAGLVGLVQMVVGYVALAHRGKAVLTRGWYLAGSLGFGFCALVATVCAFAAFQSGARADMGANTFIVSALAIVPAAFLGYWLFGERIGGKQAIGLFVALAGAALVTAPALNPGNSPVWILWSLGTMLCAATTRTIAKAMAVYGAKRNLPKLEHWAMLFWGGAAMAGLSLPIAAFKWDVVEDAFSTSLWWLALVVAVCNLVWWSCRLRAFQELAPLCFKELPSVCAYLMVATLGGVVMFGDALPLSKVLGLLLFIPAFFAAQEDLWDYCTRLTGRLFAYRLFTAG